MQNMLLQNMPMQNMLMQNMLMQLFYVDIPYINILYVGILRMLISLTPFSAPTLLTSHPQIRSHLAPFPQRKYIKEKLPLPFLPLPGLPRFAPVAPHPFARSLRSLGEVASHISMSSEDSTGACACARA